MELIIFIALYLLPSGVACYRKHLNATPIIIVNTVLGWTVIGWFICLVWSTTSNTKGLQHGTASNIPRNQ